jgi:hypothetical protein
MFLRGGHEAVLTIGLPGNDSSARTRVEGGTKAGQGVTSGKQRWHS